MSTTDELADALRTFIRSGSANGNEAMRMKCMILARVFASGPELLEACKAQHNALDILLAMLVQHVPGFMPTKSGVWPAVEQGHAAILEAERAPS